MQILEQNDDFLVAPRVSFKRRGSFACAVPFSPLLLIDSLSRKSLTYNKLPQEPIKLTVLKLDGTSFEIEVAKTATVAELKKSVEDAFSHLPKEGPGKVSWSHVWGNFCLCYDGLKLLCDRDFIGDFKIRDGDQLLFVRHLYINYTMRKTQSEDQVADLEQPRISDACEEVKQINCGYDSCDDLEISNHKQDDDGYGSSNKDGISRCEYKLTTIFRGWFSYRKLNSSPKVSFEQKSFSNSSKITSGLFGSFKNVVQAYSNKYNPHREVWKLH